MKRWDVYVYGDINIDLVIPKVEHFPLPGQEDVVEIMNTYVGGGAAIVVTIKVNNVPITVLEIVIP